ncbi:MAG: hypothetical protein E7598_07020 [Ruminococcaceae bacterium]|nr:hypothetical protein [Oscillospiraceae bacterium]
MIVILSYIIAVILTLLLAIILYPIAAAFWIFEMLGKLLVIVFDLFGKVSDNMFKFTTKIIRLLWKDINNMDKASIPALSAEQWQCKCGAMNTGKFCSSCGAPMAIETEGEEKTDE